MEPGTANIERFVLQDDGVFPNSHFPALLYKGVLNIPVVFPATYVKQFFEDRGWCNSWNAGIFEYHHYHSITHEVLGVYKGHTTLQLGDQAGRKILVENGDVLIIPAGVAHKNLGKENSVGVVGAYPDGRGYDVNYGEPGERPGTDGNIKKVSMPRQDPVFGRDGGLRSFWRF